MTREEAIKKINAIKKYLTAGNPIWDVREIGEVLDMAIEALQERAMTREEATQELAEWIKQMKAHGVPPYSIKYKALNMAIEALRAEATGSCEGCIHITKDVSEEPCISCTKCYTDNYTTID